MQPIRRGGLFALILLAGLGWIVMSADRTGVSTAGRIPAPQKGFSAPEFSLADPKGKVFSLAQLRGKAVLVNVWATWCPPCRQEMPTIEDYYRQYRDKGLVVLGVNATSQDDPLNIAPFIEDYNLTFPTPLDETGDVTRKYEVRSLPSSFFINRDGTIAEVVIGGPMSGALLRTYIEEILASPAR
jgi:cytochrome c biogenesis protein CcmG, thiol:disulfide interchange protein DsbE